MPCHVFWMLNIFSFHLISSHRSSSCKLLTASHCHRSLCHPISSQLISCLLNFFTASHLIPSHVFSPILSSSQLITTGLFSSHVIWASLISFHLSFSKLFSDFQNSSQLSAAHVSSPYVFSSPLPSSHISKALLTPPQLISALVSSSDLISALLGTLSNHLRSPLAENLLQKRFSAPKQTTLMLSTEKIWHRENFTFYTQQASAQRSLHTQKQGSFYPE